MFKTLLRKIARLILADDLALLHKALQEKAKQETLIRIPRSVYQDFKNSLPAMVVTSQTTDIQAAAMVGQHVILDLMEKKLVNES